MNSIDELARWESELEQSEQEALNATAGLVDAERRKETALRRLDAVERIVQGLRQLRENEKLEEAGTVVGRIDQTGDASVVVGESEAEDRPRGQDAVRRLLEEQTRPWRVMELIEEVTRRGWIDANAKNKYAAVSIAARRLVDAGEAERVGTGLYRLRLNEADSDHRGGDTHNENDEGGTGE